MVSYYRLNHDHSKRSSLPDTSIRHAFRGWGHVLKTQQNAWIHSMFATAWSS